MATAMAFALFLWVLRQYFLPPARLFVIMIINTKLIIILYHYAMQPTDLTDTCKRYTPHPEPEDRRIDSNVLLGSEGRVVIEHDGQQYLLRQTQAGKLILTK